MTTIGKFGRVARLARVRWKVPLNRTMRAKSGLDAVAVEAVED